MRNARLRECVEIIRALLRGEEVSHEGLVTFDRATVYTRPETPPLLVGAAVSEATAAWCAEWADGLITVNAPVETLRRMIGAYRDAGGRGDLALPVHLSWAPDEREAQALAYEQWRSNVFPPPVCWDVDLAATFDAVSEQVSLERVKQGVNVSADLGAHTAQLAEYGELGFNKIFLHHVGQEQDAFVAASARRSFPVAECIVRLTQTGPVVEERRHLLPWTSRPTPTATGGCGDFAASIQQIDHLTGSASPASG